MFIGIKNKNLLFPNYIQPEEGFKFHQFGWPFRLLSEFCLKKKFKKKGSSQKNVSSDQNIQWWFYITLYHLYVWQLVRSVLVRVHVCACLCICLCVGKRSIASEQMWFCCCCMVVAGSIGPVKRITGAMV